MIFEWILLNLRVNSSKFQVELFKILEWILLNLRVNSSKLIFSGDFWMEFLWHLFNCSTAEIFSRKTTTAQWDWPIYFQLNSAIPWSNSVIPEPLGLEKSSNLQEINQFSFLIFQARHLKVFLDSLTFVASSCAFNPSSEHPQKSKYSNLFPFPKASAILLLGTIPWVCCLGGHRDFLLW